jgi:formate dehydrogenase subunit gamma
VNPKQSPTDTAVQATVQAIAAQHQALPGGLMPALHAVQAALGHVPDAAVPVLAEAFALSRAEVHGVLSFYPDFRRQPAGRHVLRLCRAEACLARGADALRARAEARLGCTLGQTRADGAVTLEAVYCLGLCASTPALMLDGEVHARVDPARFDALLAAAGVETLR